MAILNTRIPVLQCWESLFVSTHKNGVYPFEDYLRTAFAILEPGVVSNNGMARSLVNTRVRMLLDFFERPPPRRDCINTTQALFNTPFGTIVVSRWFDTLFCQYHDFILHIII